MNNSYFRVLVSASILAVVGLSILPTISLATVPYSTSSNLALDVRHLQTCLSKENASLDVLILMDASRSLRDAKAGEARENPKGSDDTGKRWLALRSSLILLKQLSNDSRADFNVNLRNFGKKTDTQLDKFSQPWSPIGNEGDIDDLIKSSRYVDSQGTDWKDGLDRARAELQQRNSQQLSGSFVSCQILFWFTDGEPNPQDGIEQLCNGINAPINWFRQQDVLLLGGLLLPEETAERENAIRNFSRVVEGEDSCGENNPSWTRGKVVEAKTASDIAWEFVSLIAGIKNLIDLNASDSSVKIDPGTSHIEIYIKSSVADWRILNSAGEIVCSSDTLSEGKCELDSNPDTGVTTITVYPDSVTENQLWNFEPKIALAEEFKVYGGVWTQTEFSADLEIEAQGPQSEINEGKPATFTAKVTDSLGSAINIDGFESIQICAEVESGNSACGISTQEGVSLSLSPTLLDEEVTFTATLTSKLDADRAPYVIRKSLSISVIDSGRMPKLFCVGQANADICQVDRLANFTAIQETELRVKAPNGESQFSGRIYLLEPEIYTLNNAAGDLADIQILKNNMPVSFGKNGTSINLDDSLILKISDSDEGEYQFEIPYVAVIDGESFPRKLTGQFQVGADVNYLVQLSLLLLAYLLTLGLPYLFLLWSAKRAARIIVPDEEFAYLITPITVREDGSLVNEGQTDSQTFHNGFRTPSHERLLREDVTDKTSRIVIDKATVEVVAPKWNPFTNPKTQITIPGHLVITTFGSGQGEIRDSVTSFTPNLVDAAIVYLDRNLATAPSTRTETVRKEVGNSIFSDSSSASETTNMVVANTNSASGYALFIVSPFGNRIQSLEELTLKLTSVWEKDQILSQLMTLREQALQETLKTTSAVVTTKDTSTTSTEDELESFDSPSSKTPSLFEENDSWEQDSSTQKPLSLWDDDDKGDTGSGPKRSLWDD